MWHTALHASSEPRPIVHRTTIDLDSKAHYWIQANMTGIHLEDCRSAHEVQKMGRTLEVKGLAQEK